MIYNFSKKHTHPYSLVSCFFLIIILVCVKLNNPQKNFISYDNFGYYMYLPATFIYDDLKIEDFSWIENINNTYKNTPTYFQFDHSKQGNKIIRFYSGMSIMYAPGFWVGHLIALNSDYPADGFSLPYSKSLIIWGMLFSILGIFTVRKILLHFFSDLETSVTLIFLILGTNLYFFLTYGNDTPHVYLFTVIALVVWFTIRWHQFHQTKDIIFLGMTIGLLTISRPSEIFIIWVPLLWGVSNKEELIGKIRLLCKYRKQLLFFAIAGLIFLIPQLLYWKMATGKFLYNAYTDPASGLDLFKPRFLYALFGFRKGWFVYAPLMLMIFPGFYFMFKEKRQIFFSIFIYVFLSTYLIASFSSLINYGYRAFIQSYAILVIPLGFTLAYVLKQKKWIKVLLTIMFIGYLPINFIQAWQIHNGVIHGSRMTREYYQAIFLKRYVNQEDRKLLLIDRGLNNIEDETKYHSRRFQLMDFENPEGGKESYYSDSLSKNGSFSLKMDSTYQFSPAISATYQDITDHYYAWMRPSVYVYADSVFNAEDLLLVISFEFKGAAHKWRAKNLAQNETPFIPNTWSKLSFDYLTPEVRRKSEKFKVYIWYRGKSPVYVDDLQLELFTVDKHN